MNNMYIFIQRFKTIQNTFRMGNVLKNIMHTPQIEKFWLRNMILSTLSFLKLDRLKDISSPAFEKILSLGTDWVLISLQWWKFYCLSFISAAVILSQ